LAPNLVANLTLHGTELIEVCKFTVQATVPHVAGDVVYGSVVLLHI